MANDINDQLILVCGYSACGKSASLRNIQDQENWLYLNTEAGKRLPFKNKFKSLKVADPLQIFEAFEFIKKQPEIKGIIIDSLTYLMDMYESKYVITAQDSRAAWGNYGQFLKSVMNDCVASCRVPVIFTAHVADSTDGIELKTVVPIKGALRGNGVESFFSTVVAAKKIPILELENFKSDLLHITEEERMLGFKYVFQNQITSKTTGERLRSPMGLFKSNEPYMDNDCQLLLNHLNKYYTEE